nr:CLAVATA3/ESR (CLE)-related protein 5-like [Ipomoea batatas]
MSWLKFSMCLILLLLSPPVTEARVARPLRHIKMSKEAFEAEFEISRQVLESMLALSALFDEGEMEMVQGVLICSKNDCFSNATRYGGLVNMQKRVNRRQVLQDLLGSDLPKTIRNNNKVGGGKDRLAPEGPDPEHH